MKTHILRRGSDAFFRDTITNDWIACKVMHVSGSGEPSRQITVRVVTRQASFNGFLNSGAVVDREAWQVIPASAIKFSEYGYTKTPYRCQETYPDRKKKDRAST